MPRPLHLGLTLCPLCRKTLQLSRQLKDQAVEAQACYSLGNTYTLLQDYERAAEYHLRHLLIAQELADRLMGGGGQAWPTGLQTVLELQTAFSVALPCCRAPGGLSEQDGLPGLSLPLPLGHAVPSGTA